MYVAEEWGGRKTKQNVETMLHGDEEEKEGEGCDATTIVKGRKHKQLLFVSDDQTRAIASMIEASECLPDPNPVA